MIAIVAGDEMSGQCDNKAKTRTFHLSRLVVNSSHVSPLSGSYAINRNEHSKNNNNNNRRKSNRIE